MANYEKIWLSPPHISDNEQKYVDEAFSQNWIAPAGPHLDRYEKEISNISSNYSVAALASGTAAIHLALILLDVKQNDSIVNLKDKNVNFLEISSLEKTNIEESKKMMFEILESLT